MLEEQVRAKDCELNQMKSIKLDLDSELRDCRAASERVKFEIFEYVLIFSSEFCMISAAGFQAIAAPLSNQQDVYSCTVSYC